MKKTLSCLILLSSFIFAESLEEIVSKQRELILNGQKKQIGNEDNNNVKFNEGVKNAGSNSGTGSISVGKMNNNQNNNGYTENFDKESELKTDFNSSKTQNNNEIIKKKMKEKELINKQIKELEEKIEELKRKI